jgi:hypothetical protein
MTMISLQVVNRKKAIWRISWMIGSQLNSISNRCMRCSTRSDLQFKCDCICNLDGALMMMMQLLLRDYCSLHVDSVRCVSCSSRIVVESCAWSCCLKLALFVREAACRTRLRSKLQLLFATCNMRMSSSWSYPLSLSNFVAAGVFICSIRFPNFFLFI